MTKQRLAGLPAMILASLLALALVPDSARAQGGGCVTQVQLAAPFAAGPGIVQACVLFQHGTLLRSVDGHTLDASGRLYVARETTGTAGGVTLIDLSMSSSMGALPIDAGRVQVVVNGLPRTDQVVWEESTNDLLVSLELGSQGEVRRIDLDSDPPVVTTVTAAVNNPEGLVILPAGHCEFGNPGELFIAEDSMTGFVRKFGALGSELCPAGPSESFAIAGPFQRPEGMAIGDFNGAGEFALYVAETATASLPQSDSILKITAVDPQTFTATTFASLPPGPDTLQEPDNVVFDPYSESFFASEDRGGTTGRIFRVKPDGTMVLFASSLDFPQGMSFHESGVMFVSEQGSDRVIVIDGWRTRFQRGDANADGLIDTADALGIFGYLFLGESSACWDALDVNDDSTINLSDVVYLLYYLFQNGAPPEPPFGPPASCGVDPGTGSAGIDPTIDLVGCRQYRPGCEIAW